MAISFVDKCDNTWKPLWGLARELYADGNFTKPTSLHGQSTSLFPTLKNFSEAKSTFVAEIPILTGINKNLVTRHMPNGCYQYVSDISNEFVDGEYVNKKYLIFARSHTKYYSRHSTCKDKRPQKFYCLCALILIGSSIRTSQHQYQLLTV